MTARLYVTVYESDDPKGASLGTVDAHGRGEALTYRHVADGEGEGRIRINRGHADAALLTQGRYCKVHSDIGIVGAFWLENGPVNLSSRDEQGGEFIEWSGRGAIGITDRGRLLEEKYAPAPPASTLRGSYDRPGIWRWSSQGGTDPEFYGGILARAIEEGQNQPGTPLADVTLNFTRALDSSGDAWDEVADEYTTAIGTSALDLMRQFTGMGIIVQMSHDLVLSAWNRDNFGTDRSGTFGAATVRFEKGVNIAAAIERKIHDWVRVSHLLVEYADNQYTVVTDPAYPATAAPRWGFISHTETADEATAIRMGEENIAARKRRSDVFSFPLQDHGSDPANGLYEPGPPGSGGHFFVGDLVTMHTGSDTYDVNAVAYPVSAITWNLLPTGDYAVIVEIGQGYHWTEGSGPGLCCGPLAPTQTISRCGSWDWAGGVADTIPAISSLSQPETTAGGPGQTGWTLQSGEGGFIQETGAGGVGRWLPGTTTAPSHVFSTAREGDVVTVTARVRNIRHVGSAAGGVQIGFVSGVWDGYTLLSSASVGAVAHDDPFTEISASFTAPAGTVGVALKVEDESDVEHVEWCVTTPGDTTQPIGSDSPGDSDQYATLAHSHEHADQSADADAIHAASQVSIADAGGHFTGTDVEAALQELGAGTAGSFLTTTDGTDDVTVVAASGATHTIENPTANVQDITLTDDCTFTMPPVVAGKSFVVWQRQDGTGGHVPTYSGVSWVGGTAPDFPTTAGGMVPVVFFADASTWHGAMVGGGAATEHDHDADYAALVHTHDASGAFVVDAGTPTYDDADPSGVEVSILSQWGIDATGDPYFNSAGVTSGEEAALIRDPDTGQYLLRSYEF